MAADTYSTATLDRWHGLPQPVSQTCCLLLGPELLIAVALASISATKIQVLRYASHSNLSQQEKETYETKHDDNEEHESKWDHKT